MDENPRSVSPFRAGFDCRCPRCGVGQLFAGRWTLDLMESCGECDLSYKFIDSGDGPAVFVIMIMGFLMLLVLFGLVLEMA